MNKNSILELMNYISKKIDYFYDYYKEENIEETSYSSWNTRDVIGHINGWLKYSEDLVEKIKLNKSIENINYNEIEAVNKEIYEKYKNKSLENTLDEFKMLLEKYNDVLDLYDNEDLKGNTFPTGFSFEMWKYMVLDLGTHPIMHLLYHYLKNNDFNEFIKEVEDSKQYFFEYSGNKYSEYNFNNFCENKKEKNELFKKLKEYSKNNEIIDEIIKININE